MDKKKPISLEERKIIQLEMLKEIDTFCRNNHIRYSLAFGTLLGAIRHQGFIPWDDDVDIMMPLPDMLRFKKIFHSDTIKYCDVDTENNYEFAFSRIANIKTYDKRGLISKTYGVCIDTYPIVSIPDTVEAQHSFFEDAQLYFDKRKRYRRWNSRIIKAIPIKAIPGLSTSVRLYRNYLFNTVSYGSTNAYYIVAGPLKIRDKMIYDRDIFNELREVKFEDGNFMAISNYDYFLSLRYGDYMKLPPEEDRHPYHGFHYYWR